MNQLSCVGACVNNPISKTTPSLVFSKTNISRLVSGSVWPKYTKNPNGEISSLRFHSLAVGQSAVTTRIKFILKFRRRWLVDGVNRRKLRVGTSFSWSKMDKPRSSGITSNSRTCSNGFDPVWSVHLTDLAPGFCGRFGNISAASGGDEEPLWPPVVLSRTCIGGDLRPKVLNRSVSSDSLSKTTMWGNRSHVF